MTVYIHEMKRSRKTMMIWSISVAALILLCMLMFPEMKESAGSITDMFSSMGGFTEAFGLDKLELGTAVGFYGTEAGAMLSIGGGMFAAMLGVSMLSKEEGGHTSEFLFSHPIRRSSVVIQKLLSVMSNVVLFNVICLASALLSFAIIGEGLEPGDFALFHLAQLIMQIEIACICFAISAFMRAHSMGVGLGLSLLLYFLSLLSNISENASFLKYITPYQYSDPAKVLSSGSLDAPLVIIGICAASAAAAIAFIKYTKKDLAA